MTTDKIEVTSASDDEEEDEDEELSTKGAIVIDEVAELVELLGTLANVELGTE